MFKHYEFISTGNISSHFSKANNYSKEKYRENVSGVDITHFAMVKRKNAFICKACYVRTTRVK